MSEELFASGKRKKRSTKKKSAKRHTKKGGNIFGDVWDFVKNDALPVAGQVASLVGLAGRKRKASKKKSKRMSKRHTAGAKRKTRKAKRSTKRPTKRKTAGAKRKTRKVKRSTKRPTKRRTAGKRITAGKARVGHDLNSARANLKKALATLQRMI